MDAEQIDHEPADRLEFDSLEELDTIMSPFRLRLLGCFREPATAREAADHLGVGVTRLYRHLHLLEGNGFLVRVATRPKGKTNEQLYQIGARTVGPSPEYMDRYGTEGEAELRRLILRTAEVDAIDAALAADLPEGLSELSLNRLRLSESDLRELIANLNDLVADYSNRDGRIEVSVLTSITPVDINDTPAKERS